MKYFTSILTDVDRFIAACCGLISKQILEETAGAHSYLMKMFQFKDLHELYKTLRKMQH